ncbi:MAG: threonine synthase [Chloroflexi bacterium]|nr:threonine synthase [Chloroflexota bacterium]MCI0578950.1 threonine synthase [Chloroflexota bacterium]MCI0646887.1 threonine synthase [Chloroflexota bacterium]MCI0730795.1 threonine synthase [Chloroflexota bacterium]
MSYVTGLRCVICGARYRPDQVRYVCPRHGNEGVLDVEYDYPAISRALGLAAGQPATLARNSFGRGMFAYRPLLPVDESTPEPLLLVGGTPLYEAPRLAAAAGVQQVWVKDDGRNPTASLKDRASALAVMKAREAGAAVITTASTGNAAAALAGLAASTGQATVIFVPAAAPPAKIAQLLVYGATVLLVEGTYDDAFDLCLEASTAFGWYCRNTAYNPYMAEGKKTVVFELYDQLRLKPPGGSNLPEVALTHLFVSVGDGCILGGVYKGLRDLVGLGLLAEMPHLMGVQAAGSAYLYDAWRNGEDVLAKPPIQAHTVADSISAGLPRDRVKAMAAIRETGGAFVRVTDEEILAAIPALARGCGVFAEPAGAAAYAGLLQAVAQGQVGPEARVALLVTGNGLKDVAAARQAARQAMTIRPTLAAVKAAIGA